jgi:hypothetical protein
VVTGLRLRNAHETAGLRAYLDKVIALDNRAVVRLQAAGPVLGVWSGPPFQVVALRPVALRAETSLDATVPAQRLLDRLGDDGVVESLPPVVAGPTWVGLLPPRSGWEERGRADVGQVRAAIESAKHFFRERADGISDRNQLDAIAADVWQRACLAEVPVRAGHAAQSLGLLGPDSGEVIAYANDGWLRLRAPGGSVATRREILPGLGLVFS